MKKLLLILLVAFQAKAQIDPAAYGYYREALRYGYLLPSGSARIQSLGGAGVAIGGDISSALLNPAGLGFFASSEASGSLAFALNSAKTRFLNKNTPANRPHLHLPNFGVVFAKDFEEDEENPFSNGAIAITAHRINDFQHNTIASGRNEFRAFDDLGRPYGSSIIDYFLQQANGTPRSVFDNQLGAEFDPLAMAYAVYLINPLSIASSESRYSSFVSPQPFNQTDSRLTKGSQYQYNISGGLNYLDKLYFGAGIGITSLFYENTQKYREQVISPIELNSIELNETFSQSGIGINANAGLIWRPIDALRLGLSYQTPTIYRISDTYNATLKVDFNSYYFIPSEQVEGDNSPPIRLRQQEISLIEPVVSNYNLTTPAKLAFGLAYFFQKKGFLTFDLERVNYGSAKLSDPDITALDFDADNRTISNLYRSVLNYRAGAEIRRKLFRYRIGGAYYAPAAVNSKDSRFLLTTGLGYRKNEWGFDFLAGWESWTTTFSPYTLRNDRAPVAEAFSTRLRFALAFTYFFE